jgi:oxygen-independent coproporphyrinogen-3 oxidase
LTSAGYEQYEISNYAKPGFYSRHNSGYWHGMRYLGLGPSAHSFDGEKRWYNIAHTIKYNNLLTSDKLDFKNEEVLTSDERFNELVFTALRTKIGVDLQDLRIRFGESRYNQLLRQAKKYIDAGNMHILNGRLSLTHKGIYISDSIISDFMIVD